MQTEAIFHQHLLRIVIEQVDIQYSDLSWERDACTVVALLLLRGKFPSVYLILQSRRNVSIPTR